MENKELQFPDEWEHLTLIRTRLDEALREAEEAVSRLDPAVHRCQTLYVRGPGRNRSP